MALRTALLPPMRHSDAAINPFWSHRVSEEAGLRVLRPAELPPPGGEEDDHDLSWEGDGVSRAPMQDRSSLSSAERSGRGRLGEPMPMRFGFRLQPPMDGMGGGGDLESREVQEGEEQVGSTQNSKIQCNYRIQWKMM